MSAIASSPEMDTKGPHLLVGSRAGFDSTMDAPKSQEPPSLQPQPQLQLCRHQQHVRLNSLTTPGTTSTTTGTNTSSSTSPSPWPPSFLTTNTSLIKNHSTIELVQRPETAYFSPYRALPSSHFLSTLSSVTLNECCAPSRPQTATTHKAMGLSKSHRIAILLAIDSVFFLIELIIGECHCS